MDGDALSHDALAFLLDQLALLRHPDGTPDTGAIRQTLDRLAIVVDDSPRADAARLILAAISIHQQEGLPEHDAIVRVMEAAAR